MNTLASRAMARVLLVMLFVAYSAVASTRSRAAEEASPRALSSEDTQSRAAHDPRIRVIEYSAGRIYRLRGYAGYEIDLEFAPGERFEGMGVGDAKGITATAAGNHLFIKPRAAHVSTNLTVLTNRRSYLFEYRASPGPLAPNGSAVFALRFVYPIVRSDVHTAVVQMRRVARDLIAAEHAGPRNEDYWYCGAPSLKPRAAWDDGAQTHLVFSARGVLPAVFVGNPDGTESLVNVTMRGREMVLQRIARRFILRRGALAGCVVNRAYTGVGRRLSSGTLSPRVLRVTRGVRFAVGELSSQRPRP